MRLAYCVLGMALCCAAIGCSDDENQTGTDGGWSFDSGQDAGADVDVDSGRDSGRRDSGGPDSGGPDSGGPDDYSVTFELKNESGRPLYASRFVAGQPVCTDEGVWLSVNDGGRQAQIIKTCGVCECGEEPCAICDIACPGPPTADDVELADGESRTFTWDGRIWETMDQGCVVPELATDRDVMGLTPRV